MKSREPVITEDAAEEWYSAITGKRELHIDFQKLNDALSNKFCVSQTDGEYVYGTGDNRYSVKLIFHGSDDFYKFYKKVTGEDE